MTAGDVGCALAAVHQVLRSLVLQTLVDYDSEFILDTLRNVQGSSTWPLWVDATDICCLRDLMMMMIIIIIMKVGYIATLISFTVYRTLILVLKLHKLGRAHSTTSQLCSIFKSAAFDTVYHSVATSSPRL